MRKIRIWLPLLCALLVGCGDISFRNTLVDITQGSKTTPAAPSALGATMLSVSSIRLTWNDSSSNETGFKVERSLNGTSGWTQIANLAANTTSWDDTGLAMGTTYYYQVKANNAFGDSAYSNTAFVATDTLKAITVITIVAGGDSFQMGDGTYGPNPTVSQTIQTFFNMSKYDITNAIFAQFIADYGYSTQSYWTTNGWAWKGSLTQPSYWTDSNFNGANQPVVGVSWYEAVAFCNWRSVKEGLTPAYDSFGHATLGATGYRLPTEVEWEYAAAKGASGQTERLYAYGSGTFDPTKVVCNVSPASASHTADVGSKSAAGGDTPQGLVDMSGNVWQWCSDNYQADASIVSTTNRYYFQDDSGSYMFVARGGGWEFTSEQYYRCAYRNGMGVPSVRYSAFGFRVVRH